MKKISITVSLVAMLLVIACHSSKNSMASLAPPPAAPAAPVKGELKESEIKVVTPQYEKKALPQKTNRAKAFETAEMTPDTIH